MEPTIAPALLPTLFLLLSLEVGGFAAGGFAPGGSPTWYVGSRQVGGGVPQLVNDVLNKVSYVVPAGGGGWSVRRVRVVSGMFWGGVVEFLGWCLGSLARS